MAIKCIKTSITFILKPKTVLFPQNYEQNKKNNKSQLLLYNPF